VNEIAHRPEPDNNNLVQNLVQCVDLIRATRSRVE
jgi:hypothetical protein